MSLSKKLSSVLGRLMGNPLAAEITESETRRTDADEHIARIEAELAAMRRRLHKLEERADSLVGTKPTNEPQQSPRQSNPAGSPAPPPPKGSVLDVQNFFTPPTTTTSTANTASQQPQEPKEQQQQSSPRSGSNKKAGHGRSPSSRSSRAARALIQELDFQPPIQQQQQQQQDTTTTTIALESLDDLMGQAGNLAIPTSGDPLASLSDPLASLSDLNSLSLPTEQPTTETPTATITETTTATTSVSEIEGLPSVEGLGNDLAMFSTPSAMSLGAALAGLSDLATLIPSSATTTVSTDSEAELSPNSTAKLLQDHGATEDINIAGLRRGKKKPSLSAGGARFEMEDAHTTVFPFGRDTTRAFFGVFDGFAGKECAQAAAKIVPQELERQIKAKGLSSDLSSIWPSVFEESDKLLAEYEYVGATCTSVFLWQFEGKRYLQAANVGDSNAYLFRSHKAIMLTTEHKVTSSAEKQRLRSMGIEVTPNQTRINGIAVARALGNRFVKEMNLGIVSTPSISQSYTLGPEDSFIIIASDGIWDVISGQAACELIENESDATAMAQKLIHHAVGCVKCLDNVTVIVIRL